MKKELENKQIAADLCKLAILLNTYNLCGDVSPLDGAGQSFIETESKIWKYNLRKITFNDADEVGGRMPSESEQISVSLSLFIKSSGVIGDEVSNPLSELNVDIEIGGQRLNSRTYEIDDLYSSWHLDLHEEEMGDGSPKFSHPLYHFSFGGEKMEGMGEDLIGNTIILPAPRLMHPPMDAVLAIDFILQNYFIREKIKKLLSDPEYKEIVRNSQLRLWKPYFASIYSFWDKGNFNVHENFNCSKVLPFYC
ncbi:hypothetical protein [Dyadobacter frigoris]|uniref:Uncharacterized protein n=1 Tax=Dyadobacter frigoris TaxID=2576211 RepID=A0A4U6D7D6_9BACT|nr:hypothetical protein [Dyadobacter frigoris]TKT93340.1 hypothetical protein FDK13_05680 [Dyadobacter frigoris]